MTTLVQISVSMSFSTSKFALTPLSSLRKFSFDYALTIFKKKLNFVDQHFSIFHYP